MSTLHAYILLEEDDGEDEPGKVEGHHLEYHAHGLDGDTVEPELLGSLGLILELEFQLLQYSLILAEVCLEESIIGNALLWRRQHLLGCIER